MDVKELNVGNIFSLHSEKGYLGDIYLKAESIVIAQNDIELFNRTYCPYKISAQWLIDLNFTWVEGMGYFLNGLVIEFIADGEARFTFSQPGGGYKTVIIHYVHQLQNFWSNTNDEQLVINEKSKREFLK